MNATATRHRTIKDLIGKHAGEDVFVCGTGTSLRDFDWTLLNDKVTIGLNDAVNAPGFVPTYHLFSDDTLYARYVRWQPETTVVVPKITAHLLDPAAGDYVTFTHRLNPDHTHVAEECDPRWPSPFGRLRFCDPDVGEDTDELYCLCTVAVAGIQLAYKLGAKNIYCVGMDAYASAHDDTDYFDGRRAIRLDKSNRYVDLGDGRHRRAKHFYWDIEMHNLRDWLTKVGFFAEGRAVWNLGERSTLTAWPKLPMFSVLKEAE